ncbi:MFS transporter [Streptomyces ferrugineus]|uniref:hypothetical protein n=1 Tax=Streptomyces ferrugineus TaxID=1413221 RepID=UPI001D15C9E0
MAPSSLVMMATAPVSAAISRAQGPKVTLMIGVLIVAAGYGSMPALIMSAVPASETAAANSLNTLMRSLGTSTASAVAGVILAQMTTDLGGYALPSENGFKVVLAVGAGAALPAFVVASFIPRQETAAAGGEAVTDAAAEPAGTAAKS